VVSEPKFFSVCRARQSKSVVQRVTCGDDSRSNPELNESDEVQPIIGLQSSQSKGVCVRSTFSRDLPLANLSLDRSFS